MSNDEPLLGADDIRRLLSEVGAHLAHRGTMAELYLVGGAVKGFLPGPDPDAALAFESPGVRVQVEEVFGP